VNSRSSPDRGDPIFRRRRVERRGADSTTSSGLQFRFVLNDDGWIRIGWGHRHAFFPQRPRVILHPPTRLVQTIFYRVADTGKPLQIWRVKTKKIRILRGFDDKGIGQRDHGIYFCFKPAAFRIAWQVPVGTSFAPWEIYTNQAWMTSFGVIADRAFLFYQAESILFEQSH